ncbi:MAG: amino acid adenylation domain-containing protein, partial [Acidobacteriota bacterium]
AITWGPHWDSLEEVRVGDGATFGTLALEEELRPEAGDYLLHPALLDVATSFAGRQAAAGGFFPVSYDRVVARGPLPASIRCVAVRRDGTGEDALVFDVWIRDEDGAEVARIEGFALRRVGAERETAAVHAPGTAVEGPGSGGNGVPEGSLSPDEGIDAFRRVLAGVRAPQIIVSTEDFGRVLERVRRTAGRLGSEPADRTGSSGPAGPPGSTQSHPRPDMGTPYAAPESALEERLVRAWGAVLGIEGVGVDDNFFELGGDSLLVLQLASAARESGWSLTPNQIFENPTIRELAGLLSDGPESGPDSGPDSGPASGRGDTAVGEPEGAEPFALASPAVRARVLEGERPDRVQDAYPLSPMQQGMLFHTLFAPESGVYFEQFAYTLRGSIDLAAFHRAWQIAMDRHDILRTAFLWEDLDEPHQIVLRRLEAPLEVLDWRRLPAPIRERHLADTLRRDRQRGFDLSRPPLLRSTLVRVEEDVHYFVWRIHHILLDGWSGALLFREVFALYDRLRRGERPELPEALPYRDYIAWLERQDLEAAEDHWRRALAGFTHPTPLTVDRPADGREEHGGYDEHAEPLPVDLSSGLTELARRRGLTLNTLTLGAWALLLARYGGESEVVVGVTTSGRPVDLPRADSMIGLFINTLPARVAVPEREDVVSWLRRVQLEQAESRQYDYAPLLQIKKWSDVPVHLDLFESLQGLERFPLDPSGTAEVVPGLRLEGFQIFERTNYPLTVLAIPGDSLRIEVWFQRERFDRTTVRRLTGHLRTLFAGMVETPDGPVGSLSVLTRAERAQLAAWNDTAAATPRHRPVHELVRERAARTPDAVALTAGGCRLTYGEMLRRSGRVARRLRAAGVGAETLVAVCSRRSPDTVCALLGILESGGAYLPLDPEQPARRMAFQVDEGGAAVALVDADLIDRVPEPVRSIALPLEDAVAGASAPAGGAEQPPGDPGQLAYLLYTSGSTGRPKGVAVEHRSLVNHCAALAGTYGLAPGDRLLQFVPLTFDASVEEIFPALLAGAELVLPPEGEITAAALLRFCSERAVTILHLPTALWEQWTAADEPLPWSARILHVGGEAVSATVLRRWARRAPRPVRFLNGYGPTEATILTTCFETASDRAVREDLEPVPIGRPFANKRVHLLDAALRRVPVGVPGQLWVGGVGLARGYRNRPGLTASSFLPDPLSGEPGSRLYATGDLARYAPDGRIEFLGRLDDQVKVRGVRIEPGEVESCLQEHPGVGEVAVVPRSRGGSETRLVAYVTSRDEPDEPHPPHLSEEWVSHWRHLFEDQYGTVSPARDPRDNFLGWTSSYDGEAIPEDEMREWVETTVERIRSLEPRRILEIGCGSGLLLLRLAGDCEQYVGTDFSEKALDYLRGHVEAASPELDSVELVHRSAEDLDGVGRDFDVVVLNSVVQYFPGPSYLRRVITGAARIVRPGGWIFLGDLRSLPLLPAFRASVELHRAPDSLPVAELRDRVRSSL